MRSQGMLDTARKEWSRQFATVTVGESLTQQAPKDQTNINVMMKKFGLTGQMPMNIRTPLTTDFEGIFDFQTAQNRVVEAKSSFMQLPADLRARFGHDPAKFVAFCLDKENLPELRKLKLAPEEKKIVEAPPMRVQVVNKEKDDGEESGLGSGSKRTFKGGKGREGGE